MPVGTNYEADYVIVGAGSAGCVLAERLSASGAEVVLLEAGGKDTNPFIHVPAGVLKLVTHPVVNWNYYTEPDEKTGGRALHCPRGKVLGGSSSINGMLFIRGHAADYDNWAQMGARGWSYEDVLPHFKSIERYGPGDPGERGKSGPIQVEDYRTVLPLTDRFVEAAQQAGHPFARDLSARPPAEGVGYSQMSRNGRFRASTARTFLRRARGRANLRIETGAYATGLLFDGKRCTGVAFRQHGKDRRATAAREVIVSGGAVNAPHLLHISGIGPADRLREVGIEVRHDLPGVGANYSDHYTVRISHRVRGQQSINQLGRGWRLAREMVRFALFGNGALTFGVSSAQCYTRSRDGLASPDIQLLFTPASFAEDNLRHLEREPGMSVAVSIARPSSRGEIMAVSADPFERPAIRPNFLDDPDDMRVALEGIRQTREILAQPAFQGISQGEVSPGPEVQDGEALESFVRQTGRTIYHMAGTCCMGEDPMAVVDSRLRVHGLEGLRVIDASVMPAVTTANTNAPTIMIAEKGAGMILEDNRQDGGREEPVDN